MMSSEEGDKTRPEPTEKDNSRESREKIRFYLSDSSAPAPARTDSPSRPSKRKAGERSSSQPPPKSSKLTGSVRVSSDNVLQQVLLQMTSLRNEVRTLTTSVGDLKEELLSREPPINNEVLLEKISTNTDLIRATLEQTTAPVPDQAATQQALMDIAETEETVPVIVPDVRPSEVIPDWEDYIQKRKNAYFRYLNNKERHIIHVGWKSSDPPFTPIQYLPKELFNGESEREYEVRKKQKFQEWEAYIELIGVRRDDAQVEFLSIDTHIEECIEAIDGELAVKESLKADYMKRIKADEAYSAKQWKDREGGIVGKPERDSAKIVITDDRVYAKALKKGLKTAKPVEKEAEVTSVSKADWETVTSKKKKRKQKKVSSAQSSNQKPVIQQPPYRPPEVHQQPIGYQGSYLPPRVYQHPGSYQYYPVPPQPPYYQPGYPPVQGGNADMSLPPPPLMNVPVRQPENSSFHWGTPNNQYRQYRK